MTLTPEQVENRAHALGGSDCAAVLGLSRFKTAQQLYFEKRGEAPVVREESLALRLGQAFEPVVRQLWAEDSGREVRLPAGTLAHPEHPAIIAHIDGFSVAANSSPTESRQRALLNFADVRGYEGKLALRSIGWGLEGTDQIPLDALLQTQHYMLVTGITVFDVVCFTGWRLKGYVVPADLDLQHMILDAELQFMERIERGDPPPLDYEHKTAMAFIKQRYPGTNGARLQAPEDLIHYRLEMIEALAQEAAAHKRVEACKVRFLEFMGPAALLDFPDGHSLRRKAIDKLPYQVPATHYIDTRFVKTPRLDS
jgi:putative phage-type endonuclease